eukprot:3999613-Pyramimonas_sp.AAC.1
MMRMLKSKQGEFSPSIYQVGKLVVWRRGDDFVVLGGRKDSKAFTENLGEHLIVKVRGVLGPDPSGDIDEIVVLNRIV